MPANTIGERLKLYRELHGNMSQQQLADILGTTKQVLSRYELGHRDPKISTAKDFAEKLNVPLPWLLGETDDIPEVTVSTDDLSDFERAVLKQLRQLSEEQQRTFLAFLTSLLGTQEP